MDKEDNELEERINYLEKRINNLEKIERKRKAGTLIRVIFKIVFYLAIILGLWKAYDYFTNQIPNMVSNEVHNVTEQAKESIKNWNFFGNKNN